MQVNSALRRFSRVVRLRGWTLLPLAIILVGAWQYRWTADDAMIDFRIADNLLHGHGPVFNVGERVEAYTNPLWVLLLALARPVLFFLPWGSVAVLLSLTLMAGAIIFASCLRDSDENGNFRPSKPIGLVLVCSLPPMWEFATSGLETSLTFFWIACSAYAAMTPLWRRRAPIILGLGPLIRPDLAVISVAIVGVLWLLARDEVLVRTLRRSMVVWLLAPTLLYEIFRAAYFGILVSNTALTKSATSLRLNVGWDYLWDTLSTYWLLVPLLLIGLWWAWSYRTPHGRRSESQRIRIALALSGVLHLGYVVAIGGDFMHARMLLPGLFALGIAIDLPRKRSSILVGIVTSVYILVLVTSLRYEQRLITPTHLVADERVMTINLTHSSHPVNPSDMKNSIWWQYGEQLHRASERLANRKTSRLALSTSPNAYFGRPTVAIRFEPTLRQAETPVVAASRPIGQVGLAAGPDVTIFDQLSLANPISSHFSLSADRSARPGHEKVASFDWYLARYASPRVVWWANYYQPTFRYEPVTSRSVRDASAALNCGALHRYLQAIEGPLTLRRMLNNVLHSLQWTTMTYSSDPTVARSQLCQR